MGKEISEVKRFLRSLKKAGWRIEKAIIFGSRVRGDYLEDSDIDLILVSDDFEGIFFTDRASKIYRLWEGSEPLELLCYTKREFNKKKKMIGIVREAVKEGISAKV